MWRVFKKTTRSQAAFAIGVYKLNDPVPNTDLREFSDSEYQIMGRHFKTERNFNTPRVDFLGYSWNLQLGTVADKIYKIAPYLLFPTKREADAAAMAVLRYCTEQLGEPSSRKTGLLIWDVVDGNVVLQTEETAEGLTIGLFLTSSAVKGFERI
jgi:hypothetical protein